MNNVKKNLNEMVKLSEIVKAWTNGLVVVGRLLVEADDAHELQDLAREAASNMATVEQNLAELRRLAPFSTKFIAKKSVAVK